MDGPAGGVGRGRPGDVVANSSASITLAIASQPGFGATLTCTGGNTLAATNGVATFAGCEIAHGRFDNDGHLHWTLTADRNTR